MKGASEPSEPRAVIQENKKSKTSRRNSLTGLWTNGHRPQGTTPRTTLWGSLRVAHLFTKLTLYYAAITGLVVAAVALFPALDAYLPIGGAQALLSDISNDPFKAIEIGATRVSSLGDSVLWMAIAITGAVLTILPVSWTYMAIRKRSEYDQSLVETIMILPIAVTSLVILVHDSLALAFSLAGIVAVVRFRNTLQSTGDALYVLVAIGIGLAAGVGAMEVAIVMSLAFNYCFLILWISDFGGHRGTRRYMRRARKRRDGPSHDGFDASEG
jgi:hypothetical protein